MSMSLTIRRTDPDVIEEMSDDDALNFCLGIEDNKLVESEDVIPFFQLWHIVHFLSSGTEWDQSLPDGFMIGGSYWVQPHPDEEPFRKLSADEVKAVARHLSELSDDLIQSRLEVLSTGTPPIYDGPVPAEFSGPVMDVWNQIKAFMVTAADRNQVVTMAMS